LHRFEPGSGVSLDWTVLGVGAAFFLLALSGSTAVLAYAEVSARSQRRGAASRRVAAAAMTAPLVVPVTAAAGICLAFGPGPGGNSRPARPSISGTVVALIVLVGSLVFGASLSNLVSHPALYGWTWDREMLAGSGYGNIPLPQARLLLGHDPDIAAWSGAYFGSVEINGHNVPVIAMTNARVSPPVLAGHALAGPAQIVLGPETLALAGGRVGGTVRVFNGKRTLIMRVAGTATVSTPHSAGARCCPPAHCRRMRGQAASAIARCKDRTRSWSASAPRRITPPPSGGLSGSAASYPGSGR
jgi:hypothetical protein